MRIPYFFQMAFVLLCIGNLLGQLGNATAQDSTSPTQLKHVTLVIDYADGMQKRYHQIPWKKEMTVLDCLKYAEKHPRGVKISVRGSGSTAFLTQIDDLKNSGAGKNWIYRVNDKLGESSIGIRKLNAEDTVLWRYEIYR